MKTILIFIIIFLLSCETKLEKKYVFTYYVMADKNIEMNIIYLNSYDYDTVFNYGEFLKKLESTNNLAYIEVKSDSLRFIEFGIYYQGNLMVSKKIGSWSTDNSWALTYIVP